MNKSQPVAVLRARAELLSEMGYEPTITAVAARTGVSHHAVRVTYLRAGLETRAGHGARSRHLVINSRAGLRSSLGREPTQDEVSKDTGLSRGWVLKVYAKLGFDTRAGQRAKQQTQRAFCGGARSRMPAAIELLREELGHEPNNSEVARRLGCSRQRVSQIMCEALARSEDS